MLTHRNFAKEQIESRMIDLIQEQLDQLSGDRFLKYFLVEQIMELLEKEYLPDMLVKFVLYLHDEQSMQAQGGNGHRFTTIIVSYYPKIVQEEEGPFTDFRHATIFLGLQDKNNFGSEDDI